MSTQPTSAVNAYDSVAKTYDAGFETNQSGRYMRKRIHFHLNKIASPDQTIADLGCGTGTDAIYLAKMGCKLLCVENSREMITVLSNKIIKANLYANIEIRDDDLNSWKFALERDSYDGVIMGFGSINHISNIQNLFLKIFFALKSSGWFLVMSLNPFSPWDIVSYLVKGRPSWAYQRLLSIPVPISILGNQIMTYYYSRKAILDAASLAGLKQRFSESLGLFAPPAYLATTFLGKKRLFSPLTRFERLFHRLPGFKNLGDFVLIGFGK